MKTNRKSSQDDITVISEKIIPADDCQQPGPSGVLKQKRKSADEDIMVISEEIISADDCQQPGSSGISKTGRKLQEEIMVIDEEVITSSIKDRLKISLASRLDITRNQQDSQVSVSMTYPSLDQ